ncbi:MAG: DJ-1/PfpI family protein [Candidatus Thorarchaeota archaeon]
MINSYLYKKPNLNLVVGVCFLLTLAISIGITAPLIAQATTQEDPIKILFVMDENFGSCYDPIRGVFERFGWDITTTALEETLSSCNYATNYLLDVDILLTEISDVTEYDVVTIIPGSSHEALRTNETALDLIRDAVSENLIVTAWCRAVRVLAAADVIDGKNVTGRADYQAEYEAAGATFFELVPPITDGNIITSVRSTFWREETCNAIGAAVGFYESNVPTLTGASVSPSPTALDIVPILTADLVDETFVYMVNCKIYKLNSTGGRPVSHTFHIGLNATETENQFECVIRYLEVGNYTLDLLVWDCFTNYVEFTDAVEFSVLEELPPTTNTTQGQDHMQLVIPGAIIGSAVVVIGVMVVLVKRR